MEKRRISRSRIQAGLGGFRGQGSYFADAGAEPKFVDDLAPLPRLQQNAESYMAHFHPPQGRLSCGSKMHKGRGFVGGAVRRRLRWD
jgi:hypothetical protein